MKTQVITRYLLSATVSMLVLCANPTFPIGGKNVCKSLFYRRKI